MFRTWLRSIQKPARRRPIRYASRTTNLEMEALEGRIVPTVYYFNGGNIFGPTPQKDDPYWLGNGGAWLNPYNWGKETDQGLFVGEGVPGGGDTAVFRGATEDGKPWTVFSMQKDAQGNFLSALTGGGSAFARENEGAGTLNLDRNWGGSIQMQDGSSLSVAGGRWQSGQVLGNASNSGSLLVAPDPDGVVYVSDATFTNFGTITVASGSLEVGRPTGVVPAGGTLDNLGTVNVAGGQIIAGGPSLFQNEGLLTGSSGQVQNLQIVSPAGSTIESTGIFSLPGQVTLTDATIRATSGSTLNFNTSAGFPIGGITTWNGSINLEGGGLIEVTNHGDMILDDATFSVQPDTRFEINGNVNVNGTGNLAAGTLTVRKALFLGATFTNDANVVFAGGGTNTADADIRFDYGSFNNNGSLAIASPFITIGSNFSVAGQWVNGPAGVIEFQTNCYVAQYTGNGLIVNEGTVRVAAGVTSVRIQSAFDNYGGTLDVLSGTLSLPSDRGPGHQDLTTPRGQLFNSFGAEPGGGNGLNTGGTYLVAAGAALDLRSGDYFDPGSVFAGDFTGSGGGSILIGGHLQMRSADWNFPAGMLQWMPTDQFSGSIVTGYWTNSGDLTLPAAPNNRQTLLYSVLTNRGTMTLTSGSRLDLFLDFAGGDSTIINAPGATITFAGGNFLRGVGPGSLTDLFNPARSSLQNAGNILVVGNANLDAVVDNNAGTVDAENGALASIGYYRGTNPGLASNSIAGTWIVKGGSTIEFYRINQSNAQPAVITFSGTALLDGAGSSLPWLSTLATNSGDITVRNGAKLALAPTPDDTGAGNLTNAGRLTVDGGTVSIAGTFTQTATGILVTGVSANAITISGLATLGGELDASTPSNFSPPSGFNADVLTANSVVGGFAAQNLGGLVSRITPTTVSLNPLTDAADLAISDVQLIPNGGGDFAPGASLSVQFTVRNLSSKAVAADWTDAIYLSGDGHLDGSAMQLARFADVGGLAAYSSRTVTAPFTAPAVPGAWSVVVAVDSTVKVPDPNRDNNVAPAAGALRVAAPNLPLGVDVTAAFPAGDTTYYKVTLPPNSPPVRVTATGTSVALAVRFALPPTGDTADATAAGVVAHLDLPNAHAGVYYLAVTRLGAGAVTLRADVAGLSVTGLGDEVELTGVVRLGDTLTLKVLGTGFTPTTQFTLGDAQASTVDLRSATSAVVSFPVPAAGGPLYVGAADSNVPRVVYTGKGFTAVAGDPTAAEYDKLPNWDFQVSMPSSVRILREIQATVTFRNDSATTQPAPLVQLFADNGTLRLPAGSFVGESMEVLGVKADGRADAYAPGESGSFQVVLLPEVFGAHVTSDLYAEAIGEWGFSPSGSPDPRAGVRTTVPLPAGFLDGLQPTTIPAESWPAVRGNLQAIVGNNTASYADALRAVANRLAADGADAHVLGLLNQYLVNLANQFGQVSNRYRLSAFGRGVENPYDVAAVVDDTGVVTVHHGNSTRTFTPAGGGFTADLPGDRGVLTARPGGGYLLTEADGSLTAFRPDGLYDFTQDTLGHKTVAAYTDGLLTTLTDFRGNVTTLTYTNAGRITTITDPVGRVTTYGYDSTGQLLLTITTALGTTNYEHDPATTGPTAYALLSITGPDGVKTAYTYDAFGRASGRTVGGLLPVMYQYGTGANLGQVTSTDALGESFTATIGQFGQLSALTTSVGLSGDAGFDSAGRLTALGGAAISLDANGNPAAAIDPTGGQVRIGYDAAGVRRTSILDPAGNLTAFVYDANGQLTSVTAADGSTTAYAHDASGNLTASVTSGGRTTLTTYNAQGLPTRQSYADGSSSTYSYDAHRNLTAVTDAGPDGASPKTVTLAYDSADRLTLVTYPTGKTVGYHYDAAGRRDQITTSDGQTIGYGFDNLGRLATVSLEGSVEVTYGYDANGRPTTKSFANGTSTVTTYDAGGRPARIEDRGADGTVLDFQAYTYDSAGRVATLTTPAGVTTYGYDAAGQLISVIPPSGPATTYQYDANGNRVEYTTNSLNQYVAGPNGTTFEYDADGDLVAATHAGAQTQNQYAYDARGRLVYQNGPAGTFTYEYDPLGNRTAVVKNGVRTDLLIDPTGAGGLGELLAETTAGASSIYLDGLGVEARFDAAGAGQFYFSDLQGSTSEITNDAGAVIGAYSYDPFGNITKQTGSAATSNPVRFDGAQGVTDRGAGLLDMRNRFYDPATGRFTQADPTGLLGGDTNLYRYGLNNPVMLTDPSGKIWTVVLSQAAPGGGLAITTTVDTLSGYLGALAQGLQVYPSTPISSVEPPLGPGPFGGTTAITPQPVNAPPVATTGQFLGEVALPLTAIGTLTIANAYYFQQNGFADGNKPGPGPLTTPEWKARFHDNFETDPLYKHTLDILAKDPKHPTLEEKLEAARVISDYRDRLKHGTTVQRTAHDPNELIGPTGFGPQAYVQPQGDFLYTIDFQNQATATAPAQVVTVTQQLDADLDWATFQLQSFGWDNNEYQVPAGLQSYHTRVQYAALNAIVDMRASFNVATGKLTWTFTTLDPLSLDQPVDSVTAGFLPPDDGNGLGEGFVSYEIQPEANAATGTRYDAQATIVFDSEAPIDTAPIFNTADAGQPVGGVATLPAKVPSSFTVTWSNTDEANGSGIATYDVFVSDNGAPFTALLHDTTATSTVFTGVVGHTYAFYAIATDNVGHTQATPATAQATTQVSSDTTSPTSTVAALPLYSRTSFTVTWSGQDDAGGSGISTFTVFVSDNGGAFTPWQVTTTLTSAVYQGSSGHTYSFYSVATDHVGNVQTTPVTAQATTQALLDTPNKQYIDAVYQDLLGREPDVAGLDYWSGQLEQGGARATLINLIDHSAEYFGTIIKPAYEQFLGRVPDAGGLAFWVESMTNGLTDEHLEAGFIGSPEYYNHAGGTDQAWVDAMYMNLLGRHPDPQGESYWVAQLAGGVSRSSVAYGFAASAEREGQHVSANYQKYLGRQAGQSEIDFWIDQFVNHGKTNEDVVTGFVSSNEYYQRKTS